MKKNMKKLWALALATALSVACIGCGNQTESKKNTRESIDVQTDSDATQADTSEPVVASDLWQDSSVAKKVDEINSLIDKYYYFDVDRISRKRHCMMESWMVWMIRTLSIIQRKSMQNCRKILRVNM